MNNFVFQNPTKLIFGKGTIAALAQEIPTDKKILLTMGGGSIMRNGVYDQVKSALAGHQVVEFWGIEPNPTVETLRKAIELGRAHKIDMILAVGGGSVLDGTKLIASTIKNQADAWEIVLDQSLIGEIVPFASVMTLPATGSEMNKGAVITNKTTVEKFAFYSTYPQFSILDPEVTYSLPAYQVACGVVDTFVHTIEQYLTQTQISPLMDSWAEGILKNMVAIGPTIVDANGNYALMSQFMLSATMALNGFIAMGVAQDWATHMIGHEISAILNTTHGQTLAIVLPALMSVMREQKGDKLVQFAEQVWQINSTDRNYKIDMAIEQTRSFFASLGLATKLSQITDQPQVLIDQIVERFKKRDTLLGEKANIDYKVVGLILTLAK